MKVKIILAISIFLILSCSEESNNIVEPIIEVNGATELQPLKVGNEWVYTTYEIEDQKIDTSSFKRYVYEAGNDNGIIYYRMKLVDFKTGEESTIPYRFMNKNGFNYVDVRDGSTTLMEYPTEKGKIFYEDEEIKFYVEDTEYIYTTYVGKFKCIKYVQTLFYKENPSMKIFSFYTPGIGMIAEEVYEVNKANVANIKYKNMINSYKIN